MYYPIHYPALSVYPLKPLIHYPALSVYPINPMYYPIHYPALSVYPINPMYYPIMPVRQAELGSEECKIS